MVNTQRSCSEFISSTSLVVLRQPTPIFKVAKGSPRLSCSRNLWSKRCTTPSQATSRFLTVHVLSSKTDRTSKLQLIGLWLRRKSLTSRPSSVFLQLSWLRVNSSTQLSLKNTTGWCSQVPKCSTLVWPRVGGLSDQDRSPTTTVRAKGPSSQALWSLVLKGLQKHSQRSKSRPLAFKREFRLDSRTTLVFHQDLCRHATIWSKISGLSCLTGKLWQKSKI